MAFPTPDNLRQALSEYPEYRPLIESLASFGRIKPRGIVNLLSRNNKSGPNTGETIHDMLSRNQSVSEWRNVGDMDDERKQEAADSSLILLEILHQTMGDEFIVRKGSASILQFIAGAVRTLYSDLLLDDKD